MLTEKQMKSLPKGDYPNYKLMLATNGQQGPGKSKHSHEVLKKLAEQRKERMKKK